MQPNNGVVLIDEALTRDELCRLRAELSRRGFRATAGRYPAGYRDNDRLVFDDAALAARLFAALLRHLPPEVTTVEGERAVLVGLNPRFRACRYRDGQSFQRHRDGAYAPSEDVRSERTLMLYLTDGDEHQGGRTRFYDSADPAAPPTLSITPRAGLATVFPHDAWHDGEAVTGGAKMVLRSDLLYRRESPTWARPDGHRGYVWDVVSNGDAGWLSVGRDGTLRAWQRGSGTLRQVWAHDLGIESPTALGFGPQGDVLVGSRHGRVACVTVGAEGAVIVGPARRVHGGAVLHVARRESGFLTVGADGVVQALDAQGGPIARHTLRGGGFLWGLTSLLAGMDQGGHGPLGALGGPSVQSWLVGGEGGRVHRLVFDGDRFHEVRRHPVGGVVRSLVAHPTMGTWAGLGDGRVQSLERGAAFRAHSGAVTALLLHDGWLVSGGEDGRVLRTDVSDGASLHPQLLATRSDFITRLVATSAREVLLAGYDGQLTLVRTEVAAESPAGGRQYQPSVSVTPMSSTAPP